MSISVVSAEEITNNSDRVVDLEDSDNNPNDINLNKQYNELKDSNDNNPNDINLNKKYDKLKVSNEDNDLKDSDITEKDNFKAKNNNEDSIVEETNQESTFKTSPSLKSSHIQIITPENWKIYDMGETYKIKLLDENNSPITQANIAFTITNAYNWNYYYTAITDYEGIANLPLYLDTYGLYNIQAIFYGNSEYAPSEPVNSNVILIEKTIIQTPKKYAYRGSEFSIKLVSINDEPLSNQKIKIIIDNEEHILTTNSEGIVTIKMPSDKKTVELNCIFSDSDYYGDSTLYMILPVYKKTKIKSLVSSILKGKYYKVLLKGVDGKILTKVKVKITINGKSYFRTTNSKGIAYLKITSGRGEKYVLLEFDNDGTYGPYSGRSTLHIINPSGQFKKGLNQKTKSSVRKYLSGGRYAKITKGIKKLSKSITKKYSTKIEKMVAIFNYVKYNLKYKFYLNSRKGAAKTLKSKSGNCCDHTSLIIALCRASKIPARYVHCKKCRFSSGLVVGHVWAQIYVGGTWYSADATSYSNIVGHIGDWNTKKHGSIHIYRNLPF